MGDIQELKDLVAQQARDVAQQARDTANLIAEMARMRAAPAPAGPVHVPDPAAARADKVSKLGIALRKSYKVKEFKDTNEGSALWLSGMIN